MWHAIRTFFGASLGKAGSFTVIKVWQVALAATIVTTGAVGAYTYVRLNAQRTGIAQEVVVFIGGLNTTMKDCHEDTFDDDSHSNLLSFLLSQAVHVANPYAKGCNALDPNRSYFSEPRTIMRFSYNGGAMDPKGYWKPNDYEPCTTVNQFSLERDVQTFDTMLDKYHQVFPHARFVIVGHSLGGLVGLQGAYDYVVNKQHQYIDKVITIDSPLKGVQLGNAALAITTFVGKHCSNKIPLSGSVVTTDLVKLGQESISATHADLQCNNPKSPGMAILSWCKGQLLAQQGVGVITLGNEQDSLYCGSLKQAGVDFNCDTQELGTTHSVLSNLYNLTPLSTEGFEIFNLWDTSLAAGHFTLIETPGREMEIVRYILAPVVTIHQPTLQDSVMVSLKGTTLPFSATIHCLWGMANHATAQVLLKDGTNLFAGTGIPASSNNLLTLQGIINLPSTEQNTAGSFYVEVDSSACQYPAGIDPQIHTKAMPADSDYYGGKTHDVAFSLSTGNSSVQVYGSSSQTQTSNPSDNAKLLSQSAALTIPAGQTFGIYFDYENTGNTTWSDTSNYQLICGKNSAPNANCMGGTTQGLNGVQIPPGYQTTFYLTLTAPNTPGTYQLNWLMARNGMSLGQSQGSVVVKVALPVTISMPPTQTSCPTPGTARAMISRPLAQGNDQNIVFINNESSFAAFERYNVNKHQTTRILQFDNQVINSAQISPDGKWILFITNVASGQLALQMVRMDGQGLQTLYCGSDISFPMFSPDQRWLALDTSSPGSAPLTMTFIHTSDGALYMQNLQPNDQFTMFSPFTWIDNTHFYILSSYLYLHHSIYQMYNLSLAHPQQITFNSVPGLKVTGNWIISDFALSQDNRTLFTTTYTFGQGITTGPGSITQQPVAGGAPQTIYNNPNFAIVQAQQIGQTMLFVMDNNTLGAPGSSIDTSQNGLWKINMDGTGLTRLASFNASDGLILSDTSRDGAFYAYELEQGGQPASSTTLFFSSLSSGSSTAFATQTYTTDLAAIFIVGWTTM